MNIVMVCESATLSGGAEMVAITSAIELSERGHSVFYVSAGTEIEPSLAAAGVQALCLGATSFYQESDRKKKLIKLFKNPDVEAPIRKFLGALEPGQTVVHAHTFRLNLSGHAIEVMRQMGFALVIHAHEYTGFCPNALYFNHATQTRCELAPLSLACVGERCEKAAWRYKLPKLTSQWMNSRRLALYQRAHAILHPSQASLELCRRNMPGVRHHLRAVFADRYEPEPCADAGANSEFAYVGRLVSEKGPRELLRAARQAGVAVKVIGDGPLAAELKLEFPEVRFLGWLSQAGVHEELRKARAYVLPSLWQETFGLTTLIARRSGIPCLVSRGCGATDEISDGVDGLIYDYNRPDQLVAALRTLSDPETARQLGKAAYDRFWRDPPSLAGFVDQLESVYRSALGEPAR